VVGAPHFDIFVFPNYTEPLVRDALLGLPLGIAGAFFGLIFGATYMYTAKFAARFQSRHITLALLGGLAIILASIFLPLITFDGQSNIGTLLQNGASLGIGAMLTILIFKILLTCVCFATGFKGGPIFPLLFTGTAGGILTALLFPLFPQEVAIIAVTTGVLVLAMRLPLSAIVLMTVTSSALWLPVIIFSAVTSYVVLVLVTAAEKQPEIIKLIPD
jgi:H+/Cl- antiporter ClcA